MLTLTFCQIPHDGRDVKKALNTVLTYLRRTYAPLDYIWFLEFQKRGSPHFHVLLNIGPGDLVGLSDVWVRAQKLSPADALKAYRVTTHESTWQQVRKSDGAKRYLLKYALKTYQKNVPLAYQNVGRFWGASRSIASSCAMGTWQDAGEGDVRAILRVLRPTLAHQELLPKYIFLPERLT